VTAALLGGAEVRALCDAYGIRPSKRRGQNFVTDPNTVRRIVAAAGVGPGDRVLEIGTGVGSLTVGLVAAGCRVLGVEVDGRCAAATRDAVERLVEGGADGSCTLVEADATAVDWPALLAAHAGTDVDGAWTLVANLPYSVGTTILLDLLDGAPAVTAGTVMLQQEVGDRLVAAAGDAAYGAVSVKAACRAALRVAARVPPTVFWPRPAVDSVLVTFARHAAPVVDVACARVDAVVDAGFAQRRKTLRRALGAVWPTDAVEAACAAAAVDPGRRAETLSLAEFAALADALPVGDDDGGGMP
jgi:16S rRNA (adenine1518-N6/adenine1519-N6)-dimethyltransferase